LVNSSRLCACHGVFLSLLREKASYVQFVHYETFDVSLLTFFDFHGFHLFLSQLLIFGFISVTYYITFSQFPMSLEKLINYLTISRLEAASAPRLSP